MIVPDAWLEHLRAQVPIVRRDADPEGVHQLRVAAGRLSVFLELGGRRMLRDDLKWLRRGASAVRDLDLLLAHAPNGAWTDSLLAERRSAWRALDARISDPRFGALTLALSMEPAIDGDTAREMIAQLRRRAVRAGRPLAKGDTEPQTLHRLRRKLRRLRYALEWLDDDARDVKHMQDELGEINDLSVRWTRLEKAPRDPVLDELKSDTQDELAARRARIAYAWRDLHDAVAAR